VSTAFALSALGVRAQVPMAIPVNSEFVNERPSYAECHASTIVETNAGTLIAAWFGGTREGHVDVEVATGVQAAGTRLPTWNPVLFQAPNGPLLLFYKVGLSASEWWGMVKTSSDDGRTWTGPRRLPDGILGPIKNKPVVLLDGSWLAGSSDESGGEGWRPHFELSRDQGATWQRIGPISNSRRFDAIQPSVLVHRDGSLQAIGRTLQGVIFETWSRDSGRTWSDLGALPLPNPNSGTDAVTLADGRHLLVYNHSSRRERYPLDVAISNDGREWRRVLILEVVQTKKCYAYPAVIQTRDGIVHVTYTWGRKRIKHVSFDPRLLQIYLGDCNMLKTLPAMSPGGRSVTHADFSSAVHEHRWRVFRAGLAGVKTT
jgi:predicted neuraminidase